MDDLDYFIIARPLKISTMKNNIGRNLFCVDRYGQLIDITIWNEYDSIELRPHETYRFSKLKAKLYRFQISLHSRKIFTSIIVNDRKIMRRD